MTTRSLRRRREREERDPREPEPSRAEPEAGLADLVALGGRGGHAARVAAARAAQQGLGNHAVSRVLARDPNPELEQRRTRPPKPKLRTGREVDAIFDASPYLKELIGSKLGKGTIAKAMKIDGEAEFERAWIAYAKRSYNPQTDANYTEKEAREYLAREGVRAFQDEDAGEVHIRRERADLGTQLHEGMHVFADDRWRKRMGYNVNEGVTEFFTRKLGPEVGVERDDSSFLRQFTSATHLVTTAGEPAVASAYFDGDVAGLKAAVDGRKPDGKGTWDRWLGLLDAGDFKSANALMKS
jgi:hypothetical protein